MKKLHKIIGEEGLAIINKYGIRKESQYNDLNEDVGISIYSENGDLRFSDHWGGQPSSDEIRENDKSNNMILGKKDSKGHYQLVKIVKKQNIPTKSIDCKVDKTLKKVDPNRIAKSLINKYREWNRNGKLSELPEMARESFIQLIENELVQSDYSGVGRFMEVYGEQIQKSLSGQTSV